MAKLTSTALIVTISVVLAGCNISGQRFDEIKASLETPEGKSQMLERCATRIAATSLRDRDYIAGYFGVKVADVPQVYCKKYVNAVLAGRITPEVISRARASESAGTQLIYLVKKS